MSPGDKESESRRSKVRYWLKWIAAAKRKAKKVHWDDAKAAYAEYERMSRGKSDDVDNQTKYRGYPIYTTSCKQLEASYFTDIGKIRSKRRFGVEDSLALTMSLITDRATQWLIENGNLKETMLSAKADYIHAAKATTQVIYTTEMEPHRVPLKVAKSSSGEDIYYEDDLNSPYEGEVLAQGEEYFYESKVARPETQRIFCAPVLYDEVLHTPDAKSDDEITEMAYKFCMDYEEAEAKFNTNPDGSSKGLRLPYQTGLDYSSDEDYTDSEDENEAPGRYLEGWECYCKHTKMVYWVCETYKDDFLGKESDPYGLKRFFPSPAFRLQNKHRKSMFTTPTYVYLEAFCNQLHNIYYRIYRLVDAIRRRALVYGLSPEVIAALNALEGEEYISISDIEGILEKGGLENFIHWTPVKELVDSLSEALKIEEHFKQTFYEHFRLPDILRGVSDPEESLGAQEIKTDAANDSFKYDKKNIIELARDTAEMMFDLALMVWPDETFARVCGFEFLGEEHRRNFPEALYRLRNDEERLVRVEFETESTNFRDEARELQRQNMIAKTVTDGLAAIKGIENPGYQEVALICLLEVINAMGASTQSEDLVRKAVRALNEMKNKPPAPPPPDYEQLKLQIMSQKNDITAQRDQMKGMADARELSQKEFELKLEAQAQSFEQAMSTAKLNFDQAMEVSNKTFEEKIRSFESALDQALVAIEKQRADAEAARAQVQTMETLLEETRLAKESEGDIAVRVAEILATQNPMPEPEVKSQPAAQVAPITIINEMKSGKKRHNFTRDKDGNILAVDSEEIN